jgi:hypothetical protein
VELLDIKTVIVCIYRSPESDFSEFLIKLETVISRERERKGRKKKKKKREPSFAEIGM